MNFIVRISIAFLVSCAASALAASTRQDVPGFVYLGSAKTFNGKDFNEGYYYASLNAGDWRRGDEDCQTIFGGTAHLISIESAEEQMFIYEYLLKRGVLGAIYWTSGQYDNMGQKWIWTATGEEVSYSNWHPDHPSLPLLGIHRIVLEHHYQFPQTTWKKTDHAVLHRYICEVIEPISSSLN